MAINFPINPISGQTYDVGGVRYTYVYTSPTLGYWAILEPGLTGPATDTDITNGTSPFKFVTPPQLKDVNDLAASAAFISSRVAQFGGVDLFNGILNAYTANGITAQWGNYASTTYNTNTVAFPVAFDTEAWIVLLQPLDAEPTDIAVKYMLRSKGAANFTFTWQSGNDAPAGDDPNTVWCWFAVGRSDQG